MCANKLLNACRPGIINAWLDDSFLVSIHLNAEVLVTGGRLTVRLIAVLA
jgi:hypothetical protein